MKSKGINRFVSGDLKTWIQETWGTVRVAMYDGLMKDFYEEHFPNGMQLKKVSAKR